MSPRPDDTWISETQLRRLRELGTRRSLPAGTTLFVEGDAPYDVMIIEFGSVKLTTTSLIGHEVVLDILDAGELLGELSAIDRAPRSATAVALTAIELTALPADRFLDVLTGSPEAMRALLTSVVQRLRHSNRRQLEYSSSDALGRVCARLVELADRTHPRSGDAFPNSLDIGLTQTELAQWCGLSRESVVKALRKLRDLGWISTNDRTITMHDDAQLRARAKL